MSCPVAMDVCDSFKAAEFEPSSTTGTLVTVDSIAMTLGAMVTVGRAEGLDVTGTLVVFDTAEVLEVAEILGASDVFGAVEVGTMVRTVVVDIRVAAG